MNILKKTGTLYALKKLPRVSMLEICTCIVPYVKQYGLTLNRKEICFPEKRRYLQKLIQIVSANGIYETSIPYESIVKIEENSGGLFFWLRTGHVFQFTPDCPLWRIHNPYRYGEPSGITVWWWGFSGDIILRWWKIKKLFRRRVTP